MIAFKFRCLLLLLVLEILFTYVCGCASTRPRRDTDGRSQPKTEIIAPSKGAVPGPQICDMRISIKISDPIAPYLSDFGIVSVTGDEGFRISETFPVKFGTQVVIIPELEQGRYDVEATYGDYIATKCVILGCLCQDNWREVFAQYAAASMRLSIPYGGKSHSGSGSSSGGWVYGSSPYWGGSYAPSVQGGGGGYGWSTMYDLNYGSFGMCDSMSYGYGPKLTGSGQQKPPCSMITPCGKNISFEFPKDAK